MLKIHNTLSRKIEEFKPIDPERVKFYTCGLTVYDYAHIGNLRSFIFADVLSRTLEYNGLNVEWVMNYTDIDDKTIKGAVKIHGEKASVQDLYTYTQTYIDAFHGDLTSVGIRKDTINFIRVTDKIAETQEFIMELLSKGYAYTAPDGSTYFSIERYQQDFGDYGELVGKGFLEGKQIGARVQMDEYEKDNLSDFALWKTYVPEDGEIFWDHPQLGKGRPGWHIECSVINKESFDGTTDIHTGGVDLVFPHHTNEIAQSQPLYKPFTNYWAHCEHLLVDGKKMAKRDKNFYVLKDLAEKLDNAGLAFRYLMLQSHYKTQLNFTWESLEAAHTALGRLHEFMRHEDEDSSEHDNNTTEYENRFLGAINEDLNTSKALAVVWELIGDKKVSTKSKHSLLLHFDTVLGLNLNNPPQAKEVQIPEEIKKLALERDEARKNKDYAKSDELRQQIEAAGFKILDTSEGTKVV